MQKKKNPVVPVARHPGARGNGKTSFATIAKTVPATQAPELANNREGCPKQDVTPVAELTGSDSATALGITAHAHAPVLALCRRLIEAGHDPDRSLHVYRGTILALVVRSIGEGAKLTVKSAGNGRPIFALDASWEGAGGPPERQNGSEEGKGRAEPVRAPVGESPP